MKRKLTTNSRVVKDIFAQYRDTYLALCELMNNSIQAEATRIDIEIDYAKEDELSKTLIKCLKIKDNGIGVNQSEVDTKLLNIGTQSKTDGKGIGRFASLQLGKDVNIETIGYNDSTKKFTRSIIPIKSEYFSKGKNIAEVEVNTIEEVLEGKHNTYYQVEINDFYDSVETEGQPKKKVCDKLLYPRIKDVIFETYPIQIFNLKVKFFINGEYINPQEYVEGEPERKKTIFTDKKGKEHNVFFTYFKLKADVGKIKTFLTVKNAGVDTIAGTLEYNADWLSPKIGSHFIYVSSDLFTVDRFRNLDISEMDESLKQLTQFIKETLNGYFKTKNKEYDDFTERLKKDKYYPYKDREPASQSEEIVFDKLAYLVEEKHHLLNKKNELRELVYPLIERSIENGDLTNVLRHILKLNDDLIQKFNQLLDKVDLEQVILFSSKVAKKLEDIEFLEKLNYSEISKHVKERSQLHKVLERMLWVFGEQYSEATNLLSDKNLVNNLKELRDKTMQYKEDDKADNINKDIEDEKVKLITDLFMYSERIIDEEKREVLVVELKAPRVKLSSKEAQQVKDYADVIEENGKFSNQIQYKILLVGSAINRKLKKELKGIRKLKPYSPYFYWANEDGNIEIWVIEWSEIFENMKRKLKYMSSELEVRDISITDKIKEDFDDLDFDKVKSKLKKVK